MDSLVTCGYACISTYYLISKNLIAMSSLSNHMVYRMDTVAYIHVHVCVLKYYNNPDVNMYMYI